MDISAVEFGTQLGHFAKFACFLNCCIGKVYTRHDSAHSTKGKRIEAEVTLQMENSFSGEVTKCFELNRS